MISDRKTSNTVRAGGVAVFGLAILGMGAMAGLAVAGRSTPGSRPDRPLPTMSLSWIVIVAVVETILITIGTVVVLSMVSDVRRRRSIVPRPPSGDPAVDGGLSAVEAAVDRDGAYEAMVAGVLAATGATTAAVILRSGRGAVEIATLVGESVEADLLIVEGVLDAVDRTTPRRWVDAGPGDVGTEDSQDPSRSFIVAPLRQDGRAVGLLVGSRAGGSAFGLHDLDVVCRLAAVGLPADAPLVDDVTDLPTRRRLDRDLDGGIPTEGGVGLAVVAVDQFFRLRHQFGDAAIDQVLRDLVAVVAAEVRDGDLVYRYDDGQFGVLLPSAGPAETAEIAERLRAVIESHDFGLGDGARAGRITVSVGTVVAEDGDVDHLTTRADLALSEAERFGRNRVVAGDRG